MAAAVTKSASPASSGGSVAAPVSHFNHRWVWALLIFSVVVMAVGVLSQSGFRLPGVVEKEQPKTATVSGPVICELSSEMPGFRVEVPTGKAFVIDGEWSKLDWIELRFWSGRQDRFHKANGAWRDARGQVVGKDKPTIWLRNVKAEDRVFWLRGSPSARLIVEFTD